MEVPVWEKAMMAAELQRYWSDNNVSITLSFGPDEHDQVGSIIESFSDKLKVMSFILKDGAGAISYEQAPYEPIAKEEGVYYRPSGEINHAALYGDLGDAEVERGCEGDACELPWVATPVSA
jgi:hypothetical protein